MGKILTEQKLIVKREDDVAYSRSDHDFHLLIYQACGNELLKEILEGLRYKALPLAFKLSPHYAEFFAFHKDILTAFQKHESKAAEKAMQHHNRRMLEILRHEMTLEVSVDATQPYENVPITYVLLW